MAALRITLCAVFFVTVAFSKPIYLNVGEDSSKSSESSESNSSEETAIHVEPSQEPVQPETDMPNVVEETDPLGTAGTAGPSPATLDTSVVPGLEDPQTSTDNLQLMPDDPSQTALGIDISQDMPESNPAHDTINANIEHALPDPDVSPLPGLTETHVTIGINGTNQPQVTTTPHEGFLKGATPTFLPLVIKSTPPTSSTAPLLPISIGATLTGVPVCFTFQFATHAPDPPRGDSI